MERAGMVLRLRTLVIVVMLAALAGAGLRAFFESSAPTASRHSDTAERTRSDGSHSARSSVGAVAAAVRFVRSGQRIYDLAPADRDAALRTMAASASADGWIADQQRVFTELDGIANRGEGALTWDVSVLATRVDAFTRYRARVEIWRLGVLSIGGLTAPVAEYTTVSYELVWVADSGWRIWSETQRPGPSPMPHPEAVPSTPADFSGALAGFVRFPGTQPVTK